MVCGGCGLVGIAEKGPNLFFVAHKKAKELKERGAIAPDTRLGSWDVEPRHGIGTKRFVIRDSTGNEVYSLVQTPQDKWRGTATKERPDGRMVPIYAVETAVAQALRNHYFTNTRNPELFS
ncbi:MAG: hypothetical protein JSW08_01550 [archaeon]|nr:MAG: hypothetical protein JSW08_01550 [archaeon]